MGERRWRLGVVALGSALVAASILWSSRSTNERLDALEREIEALRQERSRPAEVPRRPPPPVPVNRRGVLTQADFEAVWVRSDAQALAEKTCWAPADAAKRTNDPSPHFELTVAPDGSIEQVAFDPRAEELFPGIYPCVAKALATLRLPAGAERRGAVQVNRPPIAP